ncbi:hypothetical protein SCG7086_AB_00570, partial [Chlamydiales bacterium SCGC AG-110-P3]
KDSQETVEASEEQGGRSEGITLSVAGKLRQLICKCFGTLDDNYVHIEIKTPSGKNGGGE